MTDQPHEITAAAVVEFMRTAYRKLSERFGGETTLNELRVINQVVRCHIEGRSCCVSALHRVTGIPIPTVSRAVGNLQRDGWLSERPDPSDGRKRVITLDSQAAELARDDVNGAIDWINDFRKNGVPA